MTEIIKKLEYYIEDLIPRYIKEEFPLYTELLILFAKYLDENSFSKVSNFEDNNDPNLVYSELLDLFLTDYFNGNIDFDKFELTDQNKRSLLEFSQKYLTYKGTIKSFKVFFQTLTNFRVVTDILEEKEDVEEINVIYQEFQDLFEGGQINFYDGSLLYNGSANYNSGITSIFSYRFYIEKFTSNEIFGLIDNTHPAGFDYLVAVLKESANGTLYGSTTQTSSYINIHPQA